MPSNYGQISIDNISRRGVEFDDIGRLISERLYPDSSHFIYELLQNAEDALRKRISREPENSHPRKVQFKLFRDRLEFRHFGQPFNEDDVKGISDVLKGTKVDDPGQIGKFGIGFKSVYAITASPEIHSGDEHFVIKRYIRPEAKSPDPDVATSANETVFIFPFDHKSLREDQAFKLIDTKLRTLGARVLLFLRGVDEIEWTIEPAKESGRYRRNSPNEDYKAPRRVRLSGHTTDREENAYWFIFERPVTKPDNKSTIPVEIAFQLRIDGTSGSESVHTISPSPLFVYFPTHNDTKLGFLAQGPYVTTPARDNVRTDDDRNRDLVDETAVLVVDSLRHLKEMGLLSVSTLETLPIRPSDFPQESMFRPIFVKVRGALRREALLPSHDSGEFVAACDAKLARGFDLMTLLNGEQLGSMYDTPGQIGWLSSDITQDRTPDLRYYLTQELKVEEITAERFAHKLNKAFLETQNDEWIRLFYHFLSKQFALWQRPVEGQYGSGGILRSKPILRLHDGTHVPPFSYGIPNAYLPSREGISSARPVVRSVLLEDKVVWKFLKELGIPEFDLVDEVIEMILPKYAGESGVSLDTNTRDLKMIYRAYRVGSKEKNERLRRELVDTRFIWSMCHANQVEVYRKPSEVYFRSDWLCEYFAGNESFWTVPENHPQGSLFRELGVTKNVRVTRRRMDSQEHVVIDSGWGRHRRGLNGFDPEFKVDGLDFALANATVKKSRHIWNNILWLYSECIRGTVETSTRQTYENSDREEQVSGFGKMLSDSVWLPDVGGRMHRPVDLSMDELPESFNRDKWLAVRLRMKKDVVEELCDEAGVSRETIDLAQRITQGSPEDRQRIEDLLEGRVAEQPAFPHDKSVDAERRRRRVRDQHSDAPRKDYKSKERSVRTSKPIDQRVRLREQYTNDAGKMVCQICKNEMPFKKRDGEYFFEAVEALSPGYFPREYVAQYLALCPLCAAMYQEFVKLDDSSMKKVSVDLKDQRKIEVPLRLGAKETSIGFVETHRHDILNILNSGP